MADLTWTVDVENTMHVIRLRHTWLGGRRTIWVDDQLVEQEKKLLDYGSFHFLKIDNAVFELRITTNGITYFYFLLQNGLPIPSDRQKQKGIQTQDLQNHRHLGNQSYWNDLGNALNLSYFPNPNAALAWQNRLIGSMHGYIVVVQQTLFSRSNRLTCVILVHHARPLASDAGTRIRSDHRITELLANMKHTREAFEHTPSQTWIYLPIIKRETAEALAQRIRTFLSVVFMHTPPPREDLCESPECKQRLGTENDLVLVNGVPVFLCQDCINEIPEQGKRAEKEYRSAPNNFLPGLVVGIGIALLGAMIWAAMAILLDIVAAVISAVILVWILREMDRAGTKRSGRSLALAVLLTIISVTLGSIATLFFVYIRQGAPISPETILYSFNTTFQRGSILGLAYFFTLLGAAPVLWSIWSQQKGGLSQSFTPYVETVPKEYIALEN